MTSLLFRRHRLLFEQLVSPLKSCIHLLLWVESLYHPLSIVHRSNIIVNTTVDIFWVIFVYFIFTPQNFPTFVSLEFRHTLTCVHTHREKDRLGLSPIRAPQALHSFQSKIVKISQENLTLFPHWYSLKHHITTIVTQYRIGDELVLR